MKMPKLPKIISETQWFRVKKAPDDLMTQFGGRVVTCYATADDAKARANSAKLKVEMIKGNMHHQTMFEINGSHLVSMLDAYSELNGEELPDAQMHEEFLSTVCEHIETERPSSGVGRSLIDVNKLRGDADGIMKAKTEGGQK